MGSTYCQDTHCYCQYCQDTHYNYSHHIYYCRTYCQDTHYNYCRDTHHICTHQTLHQTLAS